MLSWPVPHPRANFLIFFQCISRDSLQNEDSEANMSKCKYLTVLAVWEHTSTLFSNLSRNHELLNDIFLVPFSYWGLDRTCS